MSRYQIRNMVAIPGPPIKFYTDKVETARFLLFDVIKYSSLISSGGARSQSAILIFHWQYVLIIIIST